MKNIFLDCGAHRGESVNMFLKKVANSQIYTVHSFECNPESIVKFKAAHAKNNNVILHEKAVWTHEDGLKFYLGASSGCSVIESKRSGDLDKNNPIFVESISLSKFIRENFSSDDNLVLKIDIEGAEYEVLQDLIDSGTIKYVKHLFGEWHHQKIDLPLETHKNLIKSLESVGLRMREWCAITGLIGS